MVNCMLNALATYSIAKKQTKAPSPARAISNRHHDIHEAKRRREEATGYAQAGDARRGIA